MPRFIFQVQVRCLTPKEGGRQTPIQDGYRTFCYWGLGEQEVCTGQLRFPLFSKGKRESPWGVRQATLELILEDTSLRSNFSFIMREGRRISAVGKITGQLHFG